MAKRRPANRFQVVTYEIARRAAASATTLEEMEAALNSFRTFVEVCWFEARNPEKVERYAHMLAGKARGVEMHLAIHMSAKELLEATPPDR